jgi:hypothetical protein
MNDSHVHAADDNAVAIEPEQKVAGGASAAHEGGRSSHRFKKLRQRIR